MAAGHPVASASKPRRIGSDEANNAARRHAGNAHHAQRFTITFGELGPLNPA